MTVLSVINGLAQMSSNLATRSLASTLLRNCRVQSHDVTQYTRSPRSFLGLQQMIEHYADEGEEEARAFMRYAAGERCLDVTWHLGPSSELASQIGTTIKPQTARALSRLVHAVDQAQPNLLKFSAGRFVRHIGSDGNVTWADIAKPFTIADRPVTYNQFLGLAHYIGLPPLPRKQDSMVGQDPVLNVSENCMDEWIRVLGLLSGITYRFPKEKEWERVTRKNLPVVDLTEELVGNAWHRRYANAFIPIAPDRLALGAELINDPERIVRMLRDGIALSAWNFDGCDEDKVQSDEVYEAIFLGKNRPLMMRHIGYRYHRHPEELRSEMEERFYESSTSTAFRLAISKN